MIDRSLPHRGKEENEDPAVALDLRSYIRTIPDFPRPGIEFRDITTLIGDAAGFAEAVRQLVDRAQAYAPDIIVAVEARGFLFGGAMALALGKGVVPVRKAGKLPGVTIGVDYELEYGRDRLEMHRDAVATGARVLIVDDLLATGGTVAATARLLRKTGADPIAALFVIDLPDLGGHARLVDAGLAVETLLSYRGH